MNVVNRVLAILGDLLVLAGLSVVTLVAWNVVAPQQLPGPLVRWPWLLGPLRAIDQLDGRTRLWTGVICLLLVTLGLILLYFEVRPSSRINRLTLQQDERGYVTVALDGVRQIVRHEASGVPSVMGVRPTVVPDGQGVRVLGPHHG